MGGMTVTPDRLAGDLGPVVRRHGNRGDKCARRARYRAGSMPEDLDVEAMIARFRDRADAVRRRGLPPVEGAERQRRSG